MREKVNPIMAKGKISTQTESSTIAIGTSTIALSGGTGYFSINNHIFVADTDGSNPEYMGRVVAIDSATITTSEATIYTHNGFTIWKPQYYIEFPYPPASPYEYGRILGVRKERTVAGELITQQISDSYTQVALNFDNISGSDFENIKIFIEDRLNKGINDCTIAWWEYMSNTKKTVRATLLLERIQYTSNLHGRAPFTIEFQVVADPGYI